MSLRPAVGVQIPSAYSSMCEFPDLIDICETFEVANESFTMILVKLNPQTVEILSRYVVVLAYCR